MITSGRAGGVSGFQVLTEEVGCIGIMTCLYWEISKTLL